MTGATRANMLEFVIRKSQWHARAHKLLRADFAAAQHIRVAGAALSQGDVQYVQLAWQRSTFTRPGAAAWSTHTQVC